MQNQTCRLKPNMAGQPEFEVDPTWQVLFLTC
jgi:hypothetical protein